MSFSIYKKAFFHTLLSTLPGNEDKAAYLAAAEEEDDINMIIKDSVPNSDAYAAYTYRVKGIHERNKIGEMLELRRYYSAVFMSIL